MNAELKEWYLLWFGRMGVAIFDITYSEKEIKAMVRDYERFGVDALMR